MLETVTHGCKGLYRKGKRAAQHALISTAMLSAGLGLLPAKSRAAEPEPMTGFVNGVASVRGLQGSNWHTDLWVHNGRNDHPATVRLFYAPKGKPVDERRFVSVVLQPGTTEVLRDVVGTAFATQGSGGLFFQVIPPEFTKGIIVESNTYSRVDEGAQFGQQVPGKYWINPNLKLGEPGSALGEAEIQRYAPGPFDNERYRANINFITDHRCNGARIRLCNKSGNTLVEKVLDLTPNTWYQWTDFVRTFRLQDQLNGLYVEFTPLFGQAFFSTSIIDNKTNDASNFEGLNRFEIRRDAFLLAAAYLEGANGSRWRSDVFIINGDFF